MHSTADEGGREMSRYFRFTVLAAVMGCAALPAAAETIGYGDAMGMLIQACSADVEANCGDVRLGGGRIEACLAKNISKISPQCVTTYNNVAALLQARTAAQEAVPKLCATDAKRLCSDFNEGRARILRCLIRKDNVRKVGNSCNQAITDAGWR
jgi:hypothetical protein